MLAGGDRWLVNRVGQDGQPGRVRGVDRIQNRDSKVAEKLVYVKG